MDVRRSCGVSDRSWGYCRGELDIVAVVGLTYEIGRRSMVPVPLYMKLQEHLFGDKSEAKHG
jgi:hypothetical protein